MISSSDEYISSLRLEWSISIIIYFIFYFLQDQLTQACEYLDLPGYVDQLNSNGNQRRTVVTWDRLFAAVHRMIIDEVGDKTNNWWAITINMIDEVRLNLNLDDSSGASLKQDSSWSDQLDELIFDFDKPLWTTF